jgi:ketosteroid isomerase-like protein
MDVARVVWELDQRRRITEVLQDYCTYVDRNDPGTLVRKVFAPDATFELGSNRAVVGHENLARMFAKTLAPFTATSHHLTNVRIAFDGDDHAHASASVYAWHCTAAGARAEVWGRYSDRLVLLEEGWRIENRHISSAGADGWGDAPFQMIERLPSPAELPSPVIERR